MTPKLLIIKDFLSHSYSKINFDKFNIALILGSMNDNDEESNGAGKSTIFAAIRWALFDKSRHKKKDDIVKRDRTECMVEYHFEIDQQLYKVIRKRNKVVGETEVNLYIYLDNKFSKIECDTNTSTDRKIVNIINFNHEVFVNSVYFKQGDISIFTESTPFKRKDILKSLLKLNQWDEYQKIAKKRCTTLSTILKEKQSTYIDTKIINAKIQETSENIASISINLEKLKSTIKHDNGKLLQFKTEYGMLISESEGNRIATLEKSYKDAKAHIANIKKQFNTNNKIIEKNIDLISTLKNKVNQYEGMINLKNGIDLPKKRENIINGKTQLKIIKDKINHLSHDIKLKDQCTLCFKKISSKKEIDQINEARAKELTALNEKYINLRDKLKRLSESFKRSQETMINGNNAEIEKSKAIANITILLSEINNAKSTNKSLKNQLSVINIDDIKNNLENVRSRINKDNINILYNNIAELEAQISKNSDKIYKLNIEYGKNSAYLDELKVSLETQKNLEKDIDKLNKNLIIYNKLKHSFGKDGIQAIIIENVVEELEDYTNEVLAAVCNEPTAINIIMQKQSDTGSWSETFDIEVNIDNRKDEFDSLSGGEQFRISMAIRLAFSKILSKRMGGSVKLLLLDEISSSLDKKGINMFVETIKKMSKHMKILIITHDDRIKDKFEDILMVEKDSSGSSIIFD